MTVHTQTTLYLLRHAQSAPDASIPEPAWPLSDAGQGDADLLIGAMKDLSIGVIYSSPFKRALSTVGPYAKSRGFPVHTEDDLKERKLSEGWLDNWEETLKRTWEDFGYALPGCESSGACQNRMIRSLAAICERHPNETIVASSHGNAIALTLNALDPSFGYDDWWSIRTPDLFRFMYTDGHLNWDTDFKYDGPATG